MDRTLSLLIWDTLNRLEHEDAADEQAPVDIRGLREDSLRFTELTVDALFPRFASDRSAC